MKNILVSAIISTKNEESVIEKLLLSLKRQAYKFVEIIVVDNNSSDKTKIISKKYADFVFNKGPERSAQRNFGAQKGKGEYLLFLDADMELTPTVIEECVKIAQSSSFGGVIIPEESFGKGFWAKVKAFERSFYVGDTAMEAARFYSKKVFNELGKFDETITGPEDWDLSDRVSKKFDIGRIKSFILHNEGTLSLWKLLKKKYYYAKGARNYISKNKISTFSPKTISFLRSSFYRNPEKIIFHPILFCAMMVMLFAELVAGGIGYCSTAFFGKKNNL
ncbi:MAG: glycosyltransferase [Candidatus Levybacteria bacterium]|nr:glycosyltransferase [Candidatus Levybacteria bacterium]